MTTDEFAALQKELVELQRTKAQTEGALEEQYRQLKKRFGVTTLVQARAVLAKTEKRRDILRRRLVAEKRRLKRELKRRKLA